MPVIQKDILRQSFIDAEALEMIRSYHLEPNKEYDLLVRQDDYYFTLVTLMNRLFKDLFDEDKADKKWEIKLRLLEVAKGMLLYSDEKTQDLFQGVNQVNNTLFVATIYYVCQYEAVASVVLKNLKITDFSTVAGRKMYYMIRLPWLQPDEYNRYRDEIAFVEAYVQSGSDASIQEELVKTEELIKTDSLETVREFFDSKLLRVVLRKFLQHNLWQTLLKYDASIDWHKYVKYSQTQGILSFLPSQEDAIEKGLLTYERSFCLGMSTSAGKTYITEMVIYQELQKKPDAKILYLAPLRSLSRELTERYRKIATHFDFAMRCSYGGHVNELEDADLDEAKLLISTPEAFMSTEIDYSLFTLVICDEGQLIDDFSRGIEYELLLTRLRKQENLRFLFLSAIIPNLSNVNEWLGGEKQEVGNSLYRPCRQRLSVAKWNYTLNRYCLEVYGANYENIRYKIPLIDGPDSKLSVKDLSVPISLLALQTGQVMVFASIKQKCMWLVDAMMDYRESQQVALSPQPMDVNKLIEYCTYQLGEDYKLVKCLKYGFVYHHAGLPQDIREGIENSLSNGHIPLVYCTSTLAEGVNLPVKTLILSYLNNPLQFGSYIGEEKIKNIVGRVGRAGRTTYGNVVMIDPKPLFKVQKALRSEIGRDIKGTLYDYVHYIQGKGQKIEDWLAVEELASTIDSTIAKSSIETGLDKIDIDKLVVNSFAYKFSTDEEKANLKTMFETRYEAMKEYFEHNSYETYLESGLTIPEIERLKAALTEEQIAWLRNYNGDITNITGWLLTLVKQVKLPDDSETKKKTILTLDNICKVAILWMSEKQYSAMATEIGMSVDDVLQIVMKIINSYSYKARAIITYIKKTYEIENDRISLIPEYLQYGVSNEYMLYLMSKRLSNRIAVHVVNDLVEDHGCGKLDNDGKLLELKMNLFGLSNEVNQMEIPMLVKEKIIRWLARV